MIRIVNKPAGPAIDPEVVKRHLGIEHNADDETVLELIEAATELVQNECSRQLLSALCELTLDEFPSGVIEIARPPVTEIVELSYINESGITEVIAPADYQFDGASEPGRLAPSPNTCWPRSRRGVLNAVSVKFRCGAQAITDVPAAAHKLIIALAATWYEERGVDDVRLRDQAGNLPDSPFFRRQLDHLRWI